MFFALPVFASTIISIQPEPTLWQKIKYLISPKFGATLVTIQGSDQLRNSRADINTNFSNLNTELGTVIGTTTNTTITSLTGLTTIGTITTGVWNGTTIAVANGGTGSTTLSSNQVLIGNGTGNVSVVSGLGSSGNVLTSQGAGQPPIWGSGTIDQAGNFNWTGLHSFSATSTMATTTVFTLGQGTSTPTVAGLNVASSTYLVGGVGIGVATSTQNPNLVVAGVASTTNLIVSGVQIGGSMNYTASSTAYSCSTGTCTYTGSIPTTANWAIGRWTATDEAITFSGHFMISRTGITSVIVKGMDTLTGVNYDWDYNFQFSGNNFVINEDSDNGTDSSVAGTVYYYQ